MVQWCICSKFGNGLSSHSSCPFLTRQNQLKVKIDSYKQTQGNMSSRETRYTYSTSHSHTRLLVYISLKLACAADVFEELE